MFRFPALPLILFFLVALMWSCLPYSATISVLEPAQHTLPQAVQRISILPVPGYFSRPGVFDSLSHVILDPKTDIKEIKMGYLHGMYDIISQSPRFDKVVFADTSYYKNRLMWEDVDEICRHDTTDALLILSKAVSYDAINKYYFFDNNESYSHSQYKILTNSKWVLYMPKRESVVGVYEFSDTLKVEGFFGPSNLESVLYDACYMSGQSSARKLSPYWKDVQRYFYPGPGSGMRKAARLVMKDQWGEAASIWNSLSEGDNKTIAGRASFNIALAYERDDMLDQATLWAAYADSLANDNNMDIYRKLLMIRMNIRDRLKEQMNGTEK
ncbi:MAG: DUF6340 family protein [Bacteroidales bacterium]